MGPFSLGGLLFGQKGNRDAPLATDFASAGDVASITHVADRAGRYAEFFGYRLRREHGLKLLDLLRNFAHVFLSCLSWIVSFALFT